MRLAGLTMRDGPRWDSPSQGAPKSVSEDPSDARVRKRNTIRFTSSGSRLEASEQMPVEQKPGTGAEHLRRFIKSAKFEMLIGVITLANLVLLAWEQQLLGLSYGADLGMEDYSDSARMARSVVAIVERSFLVVYFLEMSLRVWATGYEYFRCVMNQVDVFILVSCTLETLLIPVVGSTIPFVRVFRLLRLLRVGRLTRLVRFMGTFQDLHVMLETVGSSGLNLLWSSIFLAVCLFGSTLVMCQLVELFLQDEARDVQMRRWVYENFGTFTRAFLSLFECTFSAKWTTFARPMIYDAHWAYMLFWVSFVLGLNFAIIRIVSAMFLKQALSVARVEEERKATARLKEREKVSHVLMEIFTLADSSGDKKLSEAEFDAMIKREDVVKLFHKMDIEVEEAELLFYIMSSDDGFADFEELMAGAMQLKSSVRTVDTIRIMNALLNLERAVKDGFASVRRGHEAAARPRLSI